MPSRFTIYKDNKGEWRWRFRSGNNKIIAVSSEGYNSKESCQQGILLVRNEGPRAEMVEGEPTTRDGMPTPEAVVVQR